MTPYNWSKSFRTLIDPISYRYFAPRLEDYDDILVNSENEMRWERGAIFELLVALFSVPFQKSGFEFTV